MKSTSRYDDIIHLPHPTSKKHARKPMADRAAQFSPFAALTGYDEAIDETARLTDQKLTPGEEEQAALNEMVQHLCEIAPARPTITVTHFVADQRKAGGRYIQTGGQLRRLDLTARTLSFVHGTTIRIDDILHIQLQQNSAE